MNILKGLLAFFCGLLLTVALLVLGICITVYATVLNPDFIAREVATLDIYDTIIDQIQGDLQMQETYGLVDAIAFDEMVEEILNDARPWLEEQTQLVIYKGLAYIKGQEALNITISQIPLKSAIEEQMNEHLGSILTPEVGEIPVDIDITSLFDLSGIPDHYVINESSLDAGIVDYLHMARRTVEYFRLAYIFSVVIGILSIIVISWARGWYIRPTVRYLRTPFILSGIACTFLALAIRISNAISRQFMDSADMIFNLQANLTKVIADVTFPLLIYGIAILVIGIALAVFALVYKESEYQMPAYR